MLVLFGILPAAMAYSERYNNTTLTRFQVSLVADSIPGTLVPLPPASLHLPYLFPAPFLLQTTGMEQNSHQCLACPCQDPASSKLLAAIFLC